MATLRHPSNEHPLEPVESRKVSMQCDFCLKEVSDDAAAYACWDLHERCAKAPLRIERHPFHPLHPLSLVHDRLMWCDSCKEHFHRGVSSFSCDECCFDLDLQCALSTLPPEADDGVTPASDLEVGQVDDRLHPHALTPFFAKWTVDLRCVPCTGFIKGDGYICLYHRCKFLIHKRCIQDLCHEDGTRVPRVYHEHPLATFTGEEVDLVGAECTNCQSERPGGYIGCARCKSFVHRDCSQVPEILEYAPHLDHALFLFINSAYSHCPACRSCSCLIQGELSYRCIRCEFHLHVGCALRTLAYYKDGMSPEIEVPWHRHPMLLSHRVKPFFDSCSCCEGEFDGPAYVCRDEDCGIILHKQCTELTLKIDCHPHHPEHPLVLLVEESEGLDQCAPCCSSIKGFSFSCQLCEFYLHINCASRFPSRKHYFHEHDLVHFDEISSAECNRCRAGGDSTIFRCVPCNFNLHEKCMELHQS